MFAPVPISPHPPFSTGSSLPPHAPVAHFIGTPTSGGAPLSVTFTDQSTNGPTSWLWDFGDGNTDTVQNPVHAYAVAGTYTVQLTATNATGSDSLTKNNYITATVPAPVADFSGTPTSGNVPLSVTFTDLSTNTPTSWLWNFGDGNTDTTQNPVHAYVAAGTYTVKLTATNTGGSDTKTRTNYITVSGAVPIPTPPSNATEMPGGGGPGWAAAIRKKRRTEEEELIAVLPIIIDLISRKH